MNFPKLIKPKMKVYLGLLIAVIVLMIVLSRYSRPSVGTPGSGGDTIDVALEYSPLSFYTYGDTLGGYNYDLLRLISKQQGIVFKYHPMTSLDESLQILNEDKFDIVAAQTPATVEFKNKYLFSNPVYIDNQVLVQHKDDKGNVKITSQLNLAGTTLCVAKGSPVVSRIKSLSREIGEIIYVEEKDKSQEQLFLMVACGDVPYAVVNARTATALASTRNDVDIATAVSFNQFHSWVIKKSNDSLLKKVNRWIKDAEDSKAGKELKSRYF